MVVLCCGVPSARADLREAIAAYEKKDWAGVQRACRAAAESGDADCEAIIGALYENGHGVPRDPGEAAKWYRRSAEKGNSFAATHLGLAYERGQGVQKDLAAAEKWFRQAAEKGSPEGALHLGILLFKGEEAKEAVKWLRRAAAQGLPFADFMLGLAYENGRGVRRSDRSAAKWFELAAEHGEPAAASRLAALYEEGRGVEADLEEAYFWYRVALADANDPSRAQDEKALKRVAAQLTKKQIADADEAVRNWRPQEVVIKSSRRKPGKRDEAESELIATGSGFFVSRAGHLLTNNHVVARCSSLRLSEGKDGIPAKLLATDPERDLALLQVDRSTGTAVFRGNQARPGESVVVVGFPLTGLLTSDPVVTTGIVSALAGLGDDRHLLQISAPIQPGNSGGPLLDANGHVIGVVVATLSTPKLARVIGALPQNVNFAIKDEEAKKFLAAHGVPVETVPAGQELSTAAIAEAAIKVTARVECWK